MSGTTIVISTSVLATLANQTTQGLVPLATLAQQNTELGRIVAQVQSASKTSEFSSGTVSPTPSASANTYGAWAQVKASLAAQLNGLSATMRRTPNLISEELTIQFGTGTAGLEVALLQIRLDAADFGNSLLAIQMVEIFQFIEVTVAAATRLAIRFQSDQAASNGGDLWATLLEN